MAEYIERKKAIVDACNSLELYPSEYAKLEDALKKIPAADVAPVRHGRWEWNKDHWECSRCRGNRFHDLVLGLDAAYCGRCGAKMDGGGDNDT